LTNQLEPSEHEIIILKLIFDRPDQLTVKDIARITKTRERIIEYHLSNLGGLIYEHEGLVDRDDPKFGFGITNIGIRKIIEMQNHEPA